MARIYAPNFATSSSDVEGAGFGALDPVTRRAAKRFWISVVTVLIIALIFFLLTRRVLSPAVAMGMSIILAGAAIFLLLMMDRSLRRVHLKSRREATFDRRVQLLLEQLDDRFAIFHGIRAAELWVDYLLVGPSGVFVLKVAGAHDGDDPVRRSELAMLRDERNECQQLVRRVAPQATLNVEPVLCTTGAADAEVRKINEMWIVPAERIAVAFIKRSGQEGAIGENVNITGAFSSDALQSKLIEQALAQHWNVTPRKTMADYIPPSTLTQPEPATS